MRNVINLYLDDSGVRYPQHRQGKSAGHGYDWFSLGGVLINDEDENEARDLHGQFCEKWAIKAPLHSSEIRSKNGSFLWLRSTPDDTQIMFYEDLYQLMREAPVIGLACVVDRKGYNHRYLAMYEQNPWLLCKTAFSVVVERAAKYAKAAGCRLRVAPERCNKTEDRLLRGYYDSLKATGMPFAGDTSSKYAPLSPSELGQILYEFNPKAKTSPLAQLADLYLWPMCIGGYHTTNRPYARLLADGKLIECGLPESDWATLGTKYSCFDLVKKRP
jgi:hypothetical protein